MAVLSSAGLRGPDSKGQRVWKRTVLHSCGTGPVLHIYPVAGAQLSPCISLMLCLVKMLTLCMHGHLTRRPEARCMLSGCLLDAGSTTSFARFA